MGGRKCSRAHRAVLVLTLCVVYGYFTPPPQPEKFGTNNSVRFYLAKSLALDRSFAIDRYYRGGVDAAYFGGHFYSGKAPAASFLAVPVYWLAWQLRDGTIPEWLYLYLVQIAVVTLPSVFLSLLLHDFLLRSGASDWSADILVVGYSLGTMAFPYSTQFMGHQLAAALLFCCFLLLLKWRRDSAFAVSPLRRFAPPLCGGLCAGLAVAADYQVALVVLVMVLFTMVSPRRVGALVSFAIGCIPGVFFILLYNHACFGDPLSFPYAHEAMPIAREVQSQGFFGVRMPRLVPFFMLLFSPWRGLFFVSPFLLLLLPGLCCLFSEAGDEELQRAAGMSARRLASLCGISVFGYVLFNSSYGAWSGGSGYGPRFLIPVLPFALIPIAALMRRRGRGYRWLLILLVIYSVGFHFVGTAEGPLAHEYLRNPVREFLLPFALKGNVRPNWCTIAGMPAGASLVLLAGIMLGGIALVRRTGDRRGAEELRGQDAWWWPCALAAAALLALFILHRTEETAYRYAVIGHSYDWSGDPAGAVPYFEKALRMDPVNPLVLNDLTAILIGKGEYRTALDINLRAAARPGGAEPGRRAGQLMRLADIADRLSVPPADAALLRERAAILEALGCPEPDRGAPSAARGGGG